MPRARIVHDDLRDPDVTIESTRTAGAIPKGITAEDVETEVSPINEAEHFAINTRYYVEAITSRYGVPRIRSGHTYQMFAYMQNLRPRDGKGREFEGMLSIQRSANRCAWTIRLADTDSESARSISTGIGGRFAQP